jgi:UDP-2,4-diacetamido-2,4,6-trideoxy-beta-L-altropyranose hydrolase
MICIRTDANEQIGAGHLMRCLSIAHAFSLRGEKLAFVTADHKCDSQIRRNGFESICTDSLWSELKSEEVYSILQHYSPDLVLVDSYFVTHEYLRKLNEYTKTAYVDDLNADCWEVDYLINYNISAAVFDYSAYKNTHTKLILHPQFAPLRSEYTNLPKHEIKSPVKDVFVSTGGADPEGILIKMVESMCPRFPNISFHFLIGPLNPYLNEIREKAGENILFHINETHVAKLMAKCDAAVSASGSTLYELCAAGTPTVAYSVADNQLAAVKEFAKQEVMVYAGDCRKDPAFINTLGDELDYLIHNEGKRNAQSQKMKKLVDGRGAERIVEMLL